MRGDEARGHLAFVEAAVEVLVRLPHDVVGDLLGEIARPRGRPRALLEGHEPRRSGGSTGQHPSGSEGR